MPLSHFRHCKKKYFQTYKDSINVYLVEEALARHLNCMGLSYEAENIFICGTSKLKNEKWSQGVDRLA